MSVRSARDRSSRSVAILRSGMRVAAPFAVYLVAIAGALEAVHGGSVVSFELTTDTAPLEVAGRSVLAVVGYVNLGQQHLYVTVESLLLVGVASALAARGGRMTFVGIALGVVAAGELVVIAGCPCGSGSATALWQLVG